jgi:Flp pilus assembly protein CpaB
MKFRYVALIAMLAFLAGAAVSAGLFASALAKQEASWKQNPPPAPPDVATLLETGKLAMKLRISMDTSVAFWLQPGNRVDVIFSEHSKHTTLLENLLLLAINKEKHTAIVQLDDAEQASKLIAIKDRGTITLVIRPPPDQNK